MMRGTFANIRIRNQMAPGTEGGVTKHQPSGRKMSIYDAAVAYAKRNAAGCVRWRNTAPARAATGRHGHTPLGVRAVIAESFERIHRSNLVGMGVAPLQFTGTAGRDPSSTARKPSRLRARRQSEAAPEAGYGHHARQWQKTNGQIAKPDRHRRSRIFPKWRYFAVCLRQLAA